MSKVYEFASVCPYNHTGCDTKLSLREISNIFARSENYDELLHYWDEWHKNSGGRMREQYERYVNLTIKAATANGMSNASLWWYQEYEDDNFIDKIDEIWEQLKPLYNELHTYVKFKLFEIYG